MKLNPATRERLETVEFVQTIAADAGWTWDTWYYGIDFQFKGKSYFVLGYRWISVFNGNHWENYPTDQVNEQILKRFFPETRTDLL